MNQTIISILVSLIFLSACASTTGVQEFLDPETSVTVSYTDTPLILYQDRSGRAAFARDFVNIGPIQVNQVGRDRYYLWLAIWTTIELPYDDLRANGFEIVTIYADGEPMLLDVAGWTPAVVGATQPIYTKPVSSAIEAFYEVSIDQIRLLGTAAEIRVQTSGERSSTYEMWDSSKSATRGFREFLEAVSY